MTKKLSEKVTVYHYTNPEAYKSMKTKGIDEHITCGFDNFTGLIPRKRFVRLSNGYNLPDMAYDGVVEGLLEPEPEYWMRNPEFPHLWYYLMHDVCRRKEVMLLSFELNSKDMAYVVDRAHIERECYRKSKGRGDSTKRTMNIACGKYWNSRTPALRYSENYCVPQLAIWSGIEFDRLKVEWVQSTNKFWKNILDNDL